MKNKFRFLISSCFVFLLLGVISCEGEQCGPFPNKFKTTSLNWNIYNVIYSSDTKELTTSIIENNSVIYNKYGILIYPETVSYYAKNSPNINKKIINSSADCSPVSPTTDEKLLNIEIYSDQPFKPSYLVSDNLAALFDIVISDRQLGYNDLKYDLVEYLAIAHSVPNSFVLILKEAPETTANFSFTVKYYQDGIDLDYFEFTTNPVEIRTE